MPEPALVVDQQDAQRPTNLIKGNYIDEQRRAHVLIGTRKSCAVDGDFNNSGAEEIRKRHNETTHLHQLRVEAPGGFTVLPQKNILNRRMDDPVSRASMVVWSWQLRFCLSFPFGSLTGPFGLLIDHRVLFHEYRTKTGVRK